MMNSLFLLRLLGIGSADLCIFLFSAIVNVVHYKKSNRDEYNVAFQDPFCFIQMRYSWCWMAYGSGKSSFLGSFVDIEC